MRSASMLSALRTVTAAAAAGVIAACGGGGDGGTPPPPSVATVAVTLATASIPVGQTTTASASPRDAQGNALAGKTASWSSSSTSVATVDGGGVVSGVSAGSADIIATVDGKTGQATVTVTPAPVANVTVTLSSATLDVGQSTQASAVLRDQQGAVLTGRTVTWSSSNTSVASVSNQGLVSALAAGTSTITATSEGRTGQATLTVREVATLTGLQLVGANGQPLNTGNVAGTIKVRFDATLPAGWRGIREVKIGGRSFYRDSVFGSAGFTGRLVAGEVDVEVASSIAVLTGDELRHDVLANGNHVLELIQNGGLPGQQPGSNTLTQNITTQQNNAVFLYVKPGRTTLIDGVQVQSGDLKGRIGISNFTGEAIQRIDVITAPSQAVYGANAINGVVNFITRQGNDIYTEFDVAAGSFPVESPPEGTNVLVTFTINGVQHQPRIQLYNLAGNASSVNGTGIAAPYRTLPAGVTLPQGVTLQYTPPPSNLSQVLPSWTNWSAALTIDNLAPRASATAFAPPQRQVTIGQPAKGTTGVLGLRGNYLGANTDLGDFVDFSGFSDRKLNLSASLTYYASKSTSTLFDAGSRITDLSAIPPTINCEWYLGLSFADAAGNTGYYTAQTNSANPLGTGTNALFGKLASGGTVSVTGAGNGYVYNGTTWGSQSLTLSASGSFYPTNGWYGKVYTAGNPDECIYGFDDCDTSEVLGGIASGSLLTYNLSLGNVFNRKKARFGGTGEGAIEGRYWAADLGGNRASGGYGMMNPYYSLWDFTAPTSSAAVAPGTGLEVIVTGRGQDNWGTESMDFGAWFDLTNSLFTGNRLYVPFYTADLGGNVTTGFEKDKSFTVQGIYPRVGRFFNRTTGDINPSAFDVLGVYTVTYDWAKNFSAPAFTPYTNTSPIPPVPSTLQKLRFGMTGPTTLCNGPSCSGGVTATEITMWLEADVSSAIDEIAKAMFLGIPPDRNVRIFGKDEAPDQVATLPGGVRRLRWETRFNSLEYCALFTGLVYLKVAVLAGDGRQVYFPDSFANINMVGSAVRSPACSTPRRPLF